MSSATLDLKRWGNNLGVRLPVAIARAARLHADQRVQVEVEDGRVVITPLAPPAPTLEQRLAAYDANRHGGEVMTAEPLGAEKI
jgi:antitoxin MazE